MAIVAGSDAAPILESAVKVCVADLMFETVR